MPFKNINRTKILGNRLFDGFYIRRIYLSFVTLNRLNDFLRNR